MIEQVLRALVYLHRMGIVHRDIKLENILYENNSKNSTVRLIDFGLSRTFDRRSTAADYVRTPYTISPETAKVLLTSKNAHASDEIMTDKKDVWAVGIITFILLSGEFPFIKSNSDLKDPDKMESLKRVSVKLVLLDGVSDILNLTIAMYCVPNVLCRLTSNSESRGKDVVLHQKQKNSLKDVFKRIQTNAGLPSRHWRIYNANGLLR